MKANGIVLTLCTIKIHFNNNNYAKKVAILRLQTLHVYPPPIPFVVLEKKSTKTDNNDKEKSNYKKINMPLDYTNTDTESIERKVPVFEKNPEDWIKWKLQCEELKIAMPLNSV